MKRTQTVLKLPLFLALLAAPLGAQTPTGTIEGTITDPAGASVANATVTIRETSTNQSRTLQTDSSGRYTFPLLQPGTYTVSVQSQGFRAAEQTGVHVQVAVSSAADFALSVGQANEAVEVTANSQRLDTETSNLSATIPARLILDLPDNGRNPFDFALLSPAVNNTGNASTPHIGGSRNGNNEQLIDGMTNILPENNVGNNLSAYTPIVDSVQEVSVQTSVLEAEYGRFSGGLISLVTKGGSNLFHGTAFEFLENQALAANPFGSAPGSAKAPSHRYQTGGTLSGPLYRDKTFFFVDYEDSRQSSAVTGTYTVPTAAMLGGDFTGSGYTIFDPLSVHPVLNANGSTSYIRDPFPGNKIPAARLATAASKIGQAALSYFPKPTNSAVQNNFVAAGNTTTNYYHYDTRVDQQVGKKWHAFLRFSHSAGTNTYLDDYKNAASPGGYNGPTTGTAYSLAFDNTVTFSPTLVGEFRYGFSKSTSVRTAQYQGFDPTTLGFPGSIKQQASQNALLFPHFGFSNGYSDLGTLGYVPLQENPLAHDVNASLIKILGGHTLKVGGEWRLLNLDFYQYAYPSGTYNVDQSWTRRNPQDSSDNTGNPIASLLLGLPSSGDITNEPHANQTSYYIAAYAQDNWKATRALTLNYGLRWDVELPRTEQGNQLSYWDPTLPSTLGAVVPATGVTCTACSALKGQMVLAGSSASKYGRQQAPIQWKDFGPRFGFAFSPNAKVVLRGGFGIVFQPSALQAAGTSGGPGLEGFRAQTNFNPSFNNQQSAPVADLANPYPSGYQVPQAKDPNCLASPSCIANIDIGNGIGESYFSSYRNPYTEQWNLSVQYQLPFKLKGEVAYLANRGLFLIDGDPGRPIDQLPTSYASQGQALLRQVSNPFYGKVTTAGSPIAQQTIQASRLLRQFPQYDGVQTYRKPGADSIYHAFTLRLDREFSNGLQFTIAYTGGKAFDNAASSVNYLGPTGATRGDQYRPDLEWSVSPFDVSRQLTSSVVYELPIGRGRALLSNLNHFANVFLGGWQGNTIINYADGTPVILGSVDNGTTTAALFTFPQRAAWTGQSAKLAHPTADAYFDKSQFSVPAAFTIGNAPRTLSNVRNPSYYNVDASLIKNTRWGSSDRFNVQFRLELFNALNHPVTGGVDTGFFDANFGKINPNTFTNSSRQIQLGFKFYF